VYAVIGRVRIKPGHEDETFSMIRERGVGMLQGMAGSEGGYWSRTIDGDETMQHSFWLFASEEDARKAEATFAALREMPEAPATFVSVDVCEIVGHAPAQSGTDATATR